MKKKSSWVHTTELTPRQKIVEKSQRFDFLNKNEVKSIYVGSLKCETCNIIRGLQSAGKLVCPPVVAAGGFDAESSGCSVYLWRGEQQTLLEPELAGRPHPNEDDIHAMRNDSEVKLQPWSMLTASIDNEL